MDLINVLFRFKQAVLLTVLAVLSFFLYATFIYDLPWRFNSPDEAANAYFAQKLARGESLIEPEIYNYVTQNPIVHPRSTHIVKGYLVPASFLGLPVLFGFVGQLFGEAALPYLTPLGSIMGLIVFWAIVKELSNNKSAWIASFLLFVTPAWWYYHSRSFFHNALFVDFLLLSIYLLMKGFENKKAWTYLASGLALGLALALRTSEIFWIITAGFVWIGLNYKNVKWFYFIWLIVGAIISFSPVLLINYQIYGSIFSFGYKQDLLLVGDLQKTFSLLQQLILPFGFNPRIILSTTINYLINLSWWWFVLSGVGLIYFLIKWRKQSRAAKNFSFGLLIMILWLLIVYGSWQFNDNPDPAAVTLGTSYVRYWLPIYVFLLWPASVFLNRLLDWKWGKEVLILIIGSYACLSSLLVWAEPAEGLAQIKDNIKRFDVWNKQVQSQTEENSVIVTGMTDKIFWPERQVIYDLINPADFAAVNKLLTVGIPLYWFHPTWSAEGLVKINKRLELHSLMLETKAHGWQDFSLYQFKLRP